MKENGPSIHPNVLTAAPTIPVLTFAFDRIRRSLFLFPAQFINWPWRRRDI